MRLRRGDIHTHTNFIQREGAATHRLIIASTPVADDDHAATVLTLHVYDTDKGGLLSVPVGQIGYASATNIETTIRTRLGPVVHTLDTDEQEQIDTALRAALFDL